VAVARIEDMNPLTCQRRECTLCCPFIPARWWTLEQQKPRPPKRAASVYVRSAMTLRACRAKAHHESKMQRAGPPRASKRGRLPLPKNQSYYSERTIHQCARFVKLPLCGVRDILYSFCRSRACPCWRRMPHSRLSCALQDEQSASLPLASAPPLVSTPEA
jgi:hypothetical protein